MKSDALTRRQKEIDLKLALPGFDPSSLEKQLTPTPELARRKAVHLHLHNVYYDTPEQILRRERVRRIAARPSRIVNISWRLVLKVKVAQKHQPMCTELGNSKLGL